MLIKIHPMKELSDFEMIVAPLCDCILRCELKYKKGIGLVYFCSSQSTPCDFSISKEKWNESMKINPTYQCYVDPSREYHLPNEMWIHVFSYLPIGYCYKILPLVCKDWNNNLKNKRWIYPRLGKNIYDSMKPMCLSDADTIVKYVQQNLRRYASFIIYKSALPHFANQYLSMCARFLINRGENSFELLFNYLDVQLCKYILLDCVFAKTEQDFRKTLDHYHCEQTLFLVTFDYTTKNGNVRINKLKDLQNPKLDLKTFEYYLLIADNESNKYPSHTFSFRQASKILRYYFRFDPMKQIS